jgi:hypothetical protein
MGIDDFTLFNTREEAEAIAKTNREEDNGMALPAWSYTVKPYGSYFIIEVANETGEVLGNL